MFSNPKDILRQCGISEGSVVADFGTGEGAYAREAAARVAPHGVVYAFDVQKGLIDRLAAYIAREKQTVIRPLWADLEHPGGTGLADSTLDLAIVANLLFQIESKPAFARELLRVLRPGGRVLVIDWEEASGLGPHPGHIITLPAARKLLTNAGFMLDKTVEAGDHHYGLIVRKPADSSPHTAHR